MSHIYFLFFDQIRDENLCSQHLTFINITFSQFLISLVLFIPIILVGTGSTQTRHLPDTAAGGLALYSVSKLLLIISFM